MIDTTSLLWPSPPTLALDEELVTVTWPPPTTMGGANSVVSWRFCVDLATRCGGWRQARGTQTNASISTRAGLLEGYRGQVWAELVATNAAGSSSQLSRTDLPVFVGSLPPTPGALEFVSTALPNLAAAVVRVTGFDAPLLGISYFEWCVGTSTRLADLLSCRLVPYLPRYLHLQPFAAEAEALSPNSTHLAVVTARACDSLGECTDASSGTPVRINGFNPLFTHSTMLKAKMLRQTAGRVGLLAPIKVVWICSMHGSVVCCSMDL